jgi:hypothetical protein
MIFGLVASVSYGSKADIQPRSTLCEAQVPAVRGKAAIQPTIPTLASQCPVLSRLGSHINNAASITWSGVVISDSLKQNFESPISHHSIFQTFPARFSASQFCLSTILSKPQSPGRPQDRRVITGGPNQTAGVKRRPRETLRGRAGLGRGLRSCLVQHSLWQVGDGSVRLQIGIREKRPLHFHASRRRSRPTGAVWKERGKH